MSKDEDKKLQPGDDGYRSPGRPKGSKNISTIVQEAVLAKSEKLLLKNFPKIVEKVCELAEKGDMKAAKLIFERVIPARKAIEHLGKTDFGKDGINIIINTTKESPKLNVLENVDTPTLEIENDAKQERISIEH